MSQQRSKRKNSPLDLLKRVKKLAAEGHAQKDLVKALGFKSILTLHSHLLKASQETGKPIPPLRVPREKQENARVEILEVRRRGYGNGFGVNVPQETLVRAGFVQGDRLEVKVWGKSVILQQSADGK